MIKSIDQPMCTPPNSAKAMSKYTDMVDGIVRSCSDKMAAASDDARLRLREWDLPECLEALSAAAVSGLPDGLRAELEAADSAGGLTHLMDMAAQIRVCVLLGLIGMADGVIAIPVSSLHSSCLWSVVASTQPREHPIIENDIKTTHKVAARCCMLSTCLHLLNLPHISRCEAA